MRHTPFPGHTPTRTAAIRWLGAISVVLGSASVASAGSVRVLPGDPGWFAYGGPTSSAAITGAMPGPGFGFGSLELTQLGNGAGYGHEIPAPGLGRFGDLNVLHYDWFIDPASVAFQPGPPEIALRVYPYGDSRSFFLRWRGCDAIDGCPVAPLGSWQTTNLIGRLEIDAADDNIPPASLGDIPPDAPIVGFTVRTNFGQPWHGFADNVTIGFAGHDPTTYDFDVLPPRGTPAVVVRPGDPGWFTYTSGPPTASVITAAQPGSGFGSVELTRAAGPNYTALAREIPLPGFGTYGTLDVLNYDWLVDPASGDLAPPELWLRVYPSGDSRSFYLRWNPCSSPVVPNCHAYPAGSWQSISLIGRLSITQADGNTPPASLADIPPDAPIVGVHVHSSNLSSAAWHGFADDVTLGFSGHAPITFDFEVPPPRATTPVVVLAGDPAWYSYFDGSSSSAAITGANPGSEFGSLELTRAVGANSFAAFAREFPLPGLGTYGTLDVLNFDWFIDPASGYAQPPSLAVRVYPYDDPRSFFLAWSACAPGLQCPAHAVGSWQTTNAIGHLSIEPASANPPPASLADIPPDAPITGIRILTLYQDGLAWHGFVDNVTVGFSGHSPITFDFEVPPPRGKPPVVVRPGDPGWFTYASDASALAAITSVVPGAGFGSLELRRGAGNSYAGFGHEIPLPGFGTWGNLTVLNYDWWIDPASSHPLPPEFAVRVYPYGDSRSFFLYWDGCPPDEPCEQEPTGSWHTTNLIGRLSIQGADGNPPPASLQDIPPDAPIMGITIRNNYSSGQLWHGFADNATIGFAGHPPVTFDFETPPPRGMPPVVVLPTDPRWFTYTNGSGSAVGITGTNPGSEFGSLELTRAPGSDSYAGFGREVALPGLGTFGTLDVLNFDWLIDPSSSRARPPELALRVYAHGDPRSFFLFWDGCVPGFPCSDHPVGSWQTTNVIGHLSIQSADGNPPPASLGDIPPDAPIVGIHIRANYADGLGWHGFVDNVTIGFGGHPPTTFDFEIPPPRGVPPTVVLPGDAAWFVFVQPGSAAAITGTKPGAGFGSLELTKAAGSASGVGIEVPLPGFGTFGDLDVLNYDWFIDPASARHTPPEIALRVYPYGDPRSFFLRWDACCADYPAGSWQTTNVIGRLSIQPADGNPPPASLAEIPLDAPIVGIHIRSAYADGLAWHGFVDNVTIGFVGHAPITYDFEVPPPRGVPAVVVRPGDSDWYMNAPPGSKVGITSSNPRSGLGSLELTKAAGYSLSFVREPGLPGYGRFGDLNVLNYDWFVDPAGGRRRPPDFLLRVYPYGDPRSFFLHWDTCSEAVPCTDHPSGSWQTTNLVGRLSIQPDGNNIPPASLDAIPADAPIVGLHVWSNWADGQAWHGFVDNLTVGFAGHAPVTYNFETPPPAGDLVFKNNFEAGTLSAWSASATDGGDLSVSAAAGMGSTSLGLQAVVDDTAGIYVQDSTPSDDNHYRARFYFDPNGFDPGEANHAFRTRIFIGFEENPNRRLFAIVLKRQGGAFSIMGRTRLDDNTQADTGFVPISDGPHVIELEWKRSSTADANDGSFELWIDGNFARLRSQLDNNRSAVDFVRMGALSVKNGAAGTLYWDQFESRRLNYIGP